MGDSVLNRWANRGRWWHVTFAMNRRAGTRTRRDASADSSANAHRVASGDGKHASTLARESDCGWDHGCGLDGD